MHNNINIYIYTCIFMQIHMYIYILYIYVHILSYTALYTQIEYHISYWFISYHNIFICVSTTSHDMSVLHPAVLTFRRPRYRDLVGMGGPTWTVQSPPSHDFGGDPNLKPYISLLLGRGPHPTYDLFFQRYVSIISSFLSLAIRKICETMPQKRSVEKNT